MRLDQYIHENGGSEHHSENEKVRISGTEARGIFERGELPPSWFIRPEISQMILEAMKNGEQVFVGAE